MTDPSQTLAMLKEVFPNYTNDLISCVMEAVGGSFEASLEALLSLDSEGISSAMPSPLDAGFLDVGGEGGMNEDVEMQRQLEMIIKQSREEAKQGKKPSLSWAQKLKNVFKKKEKPAPQVPPPPPSQKLSSPQSPPKPQSNLPPPTLQKSTSQSFPAPPSLEKSPSLPLPSVAKAQQEEDDEEEVISFTMAEDPRDIRGAKYQQLPLSDDIELVYTKKN